MNMYFKIKYTHKSGQIEIERIKETKRKQYGKKAIPNKQMIPVRTIWIWSLRAFNDQVQSSLTPLSIYRKKKMIMHQTRIEQMLIADFMFNIQ